MIFLPHKLFLIVLYKVKFINEFETIKTTSNQRADRYLGLKSQF